MGKHLQANHSQLGFKCELCNKICFSKQAIMKHSSNHTVPGTSEEISPVLREENNQTNNSEQLGGQALSDYEVSNEKSFTVGKRIKQNIDLTDLEEDEDDDVTYVPPRSVKYVGSANSSTKMMPTRSRIFEREKNADLVDFGTSGHVLLLGSSDLISETAEIIDI